MKLQNLFASALLILASVTTIVKGQAPAKAPAGKTAESELMDLDRQLQEAVVTGNLSLIEGYAGEDLLFTHGLSGRTDKKEDWINLARRTPRQFIARKVSLQAVEIHGDAALVLGRLDVRRLPNASANETKQMCYDLKYVHLYLKRNGRWQWVSHRTVSDIVQSPCPEKVG
jgi:hypothetical protein